ncbi:hypothetical protein [Paenibacillus rhizophilus]|nr:hypothetical protein [Paenibacillus rhizophilus]
MDDRECLRLAGASKRRARRMEPRIPKATGDHYSFIQEPHVEQIAE